VRSPSLFIFSNFPLARARGVPGGETGLAADVELRLMLRDGQWPHGRTGGRAAVRDGNGVAVRRTP